MQTQQITKLRSELYRNVTKALKARDVAGAKLKSVGEAARNSVEKAKESYDTLHAEHESAAAQLAKFEEVFGSTTSNVKAAKGTKKTAVKAAAKTVVKAAAKVKRKPGPKPGAKAAKKAAAAAAATVSKKAPKAAKKNGDQGLSIVETISSVLGTKIMAAPEIEKAIKALPKSNLPKSNNLKAYISSVLSSARDGNGEKIFHAVKRGNYCLAANKKEALAAVKSVTQAPKAVKAAPKATTKAAPKAPKAKAAKPSKAAKTAETATAAPAAEPTPEAAPATATASDSPSDDLLASVGLDPTNFGGGSASAPAPLS